MMFDWKRILHPTDFSTESDRALQLAEKLARQSDAELILLHVGSLAGYRVAGFPGQENYPDGLLAGLKRRETSLSNGLKVETRFVESDDVPSAILRTAEEEKCDVVVLGTHGRSGLRRVLMGSVAESVVRRCQIPVVTMSAPKGSVEQESDELSEADQAYKDSFRIPHA